MMKAKLLFVLMLMAVGAWAQNDFDLELMENLALESLGEIRVQHDVPALHRDEILDAAAFEQASYIVKSGKLEHTQEDKKMSTLDKRLIAFEGFYGYSAENISQIGIGVKAQLTKDGAKVSVTSPQQMIQAVLLDWMSNEISRLNMIQKEFSRVGVSVISEDEKTYTFVLVTSNEAYEPPTGVKLNTKQYGILPYSEEICDPFIEAHGTSESLLSDALTIEDGQIVFSFHNSDFIDHIVNEGGDALVVDLIERKQFDCQGPNDLFPGQIQDGYLMSPIKKNKLAALNTQLESKKVKAVFGSLPQGLSNKDVELNLKIIKDNHHCLTVPFNQIETKNTKWYEFELLNAQFDSVQLFSKLDTAEFTSGLGDLGELFEKIEAYHKSFGSEVLKLSIEVSLAPSVEINRKEIESKLKSICALPANDSSTITFNLKENWEAYQQFKAGTYYQIETNDMSKSQELDYLKEQYGKDDELKQALDGLTQIEITAESKLHSTQMNEPEWIKKALYFVIDANKINHALYLQQSLYSRSESEESIEDVLDQKKQSVTTLPLINNQILRQKAIDQKRFDGNPIHLAFLELYFVQKTEPTIAYNYHLSVLEHWAKSNKNIKDIEGWLKGFARINKKDIHPESVARANLNYWIIAGDYYYENQNFDKRKKAFNEVLKWARKANLNEKQLLEVAKYLCLQDQFAVALKLLKPEVVKAEPNAELLTYFLQAAIYHNEIVPLKMYVQVLETLKQTNQKEFCRLFSIDKMGLQMTKHAKIKSLYCDTCTN